MGPALYGLCFHYCTIDASPLAQRRTKAMVSRRRRSAVYRSVHHPLFGTLVVSSIHFNFNCID